MTPPLANIDDQREPVTVALGCPPTVRLLSLISTKENLVSVKMRSAEGVTWIRGHHTKESDEGKALIAAYALAHT